MPKKIKEKKPSWYRGNIDINKRKTLKTERAPYKKGSTIKTEESITIGGKGSYTNVPTVIDGKKKTNREAVANYKKTGKHLGKFSGTPYKSGSKKADTHARNKASWQGKNLSKRQNKVYKKKK